MTVTLAQWKAIAAEKGISVKDLQESILQIDGGVGEYFDRDGDPINLGTWAVLFDTRSYRFIGDVTPPMGGRVATIWLGHDGHIGEGLLIFESSVFPPGSRDPIEVLAYATEAQAIAGHDQLVAKYRETVARNRP